MAPTSCGFLFRNDNTTVIKTTLMVLPSHFKHSSSGVMSYAINFLNYLRNRVHPHAWKCKSRLVCLWCQSGRWHRHHADFSSERIDGHGFALCNRAQSESSKLFRLWSTIANCGCFDGPVTCMASSLTRSIKSVRLFFHIGHIFTISIRTKNQNQRACPLVIHMACHTLQSYWQSESSELSHLWSKWSMQ